MAESRRTPLHDRHLRHGARMTSFAGWDMPVSYTTISAEHTAVRERAGLFDVSHMGEIEVRGPGALELLQHVTVNDVSRLEPGRIQYSVMVEPTGGVIDDLLVYQLDAAAYLLVVNAANTERDREWLHAHNRFGATVEDVSAATVLLSIQGPLAERTIQPLADIDLGPLRYYRWAQCGLAGVTGRLSRTGYTGEDGFEFYFSSPRPGELWDRLIEAGRDHGVVPVGLGARNTLRLEAGLPLCGSDLDGTTTPLEAGLGRIVRLDKGEFIGREALARQQSGGVQRKLVGFEMRGRDIAREGHPVVVEGEAVGRVTSGGPSITLKKNIGMAYLPVRHTDTGTRFEVRVRQRDCAAEVVGVPFYSRRRAV